MKFWKRQNDGTGKCLVSLLWKIGEVGLCDHLRQMRDKPLSYKVGEGWFWKRWEFSDSRCIPNHFWGSVHRDIEDLEADDFRITGSHASFGKSAHTLNSWADYFEYHYFTIWHISPHDTRTSLMAHMVKPLPTVRETQVPSLCREGSLQKEVATHSSILAWKIPWTEELGMLQSMESPRVQHEWSNLALHSGD